MAIHKSIRIYQYLDDWLVRARSHQVCLQHTQDLVENMPRTRLAGEFGKVRTGTKADLRFCRLPVRPQGWSGPTHTRPLAEPSGQNTRNTVTTDLSGPAVHVPDRFTNSHRKASHLGRLHMRPIQWHLKNNWRVPESLEKVIPIPRSLHPPLTMVAKGR